MGNFKYPIQQKNCFKVNSENIKYLAQLLNKEPDVVLEKIKDLPAT
jgi:hypothetical protein